MSFARFRFASVFRLLFALAMLFLISSVGRAWVAEWVYPLDESSLWKKPTYQNIQEQSRRLRIVHRLVWEDSRYPYEKARLYAEAVSKPLEAGSLDASMIASAMSNFKEAIKKRPLSAEYHAAFALFLQRIGALQSRLGRSLLTADPMRVSEAEVERALFLSPNRHAIRAYAALYFQYRGWRERALNLWRSILSEDPTQAQDIVTKLFQYYREPSFLLDIAPVERVQDLLRFQEFLNYFQIEGWGEKVYLKTLPLLIEKSRREEKNQALLNMIAKTYWLAGEYQQSYFWYEKALRVADTPETRAPLVNMMGDLLGRQNRFFEEKTFLEPHLDLSRHAPGILILYVRTLWHLDEKAQAFQVLKEKMSQTKGELPPVWRNELASMLYQEERYEEAAGEWRLLLAEVRGTTLEREYLEIARRKIQECEEHLLQNRNKATGI